MKTTRLYTLVALLVMAGGMTMQAQIRIDKQQCFGGYDEDLIEGRGIIMEDDFILLAGYTYKPGVGTGLVPEYCSDAYVYSPAWIVKINYDYELIDSWCYDMGVKDILKVENGERKEYYLVGGAFCDICGDTVRNMKVIKINSNGEEIWTSCFGNREGYYWESGGGDLTHDGGVLAFANYFSSGCDISHFYGAVDGWMVAMDSLGNMTWETTLGTQAVDLLSRVDRSDKGGYYVTMYNDPAGSYGNLTPCYDPPMNSNATFIKLDSIGGIEWQECYGCIPGPNKESAILRFIDLEDGYIGIGETTCTDGDLQGAGWHPGYYGGGFPCYDIWLLRLDLDRNVVWSKCYGGSSHEGAARVFPLEDGGFMAFGTTQSIDGDVASAAHLNLSDLNDGIGWVFRTDAHGNLLWERCLGTKDGSTIFKEVVQHNDREYTIVGDVICPRTGSSGDVNCSNCAFTYTPTPQVINRDYWILHITDTVDYTTLQVPERPMPQEEAVVEVYPNPTNNTVCVVLPNEAEATEMELINMSGQVVATKTFGGKGGWMEMGDLPKGMYMLRIRNAEVCLTRKVLRE